MTRDAPATRARILAAGIAEFAGHGLAGARVDRIAAAAKANKNMIYIYFGSKEQLFDAVFADAIRTLLDTVPLTADDLPGYAGALFDHMEANPELSRLARWHGLERPGGLAAIEDVVGSTVTKIAAVAAQQSAGGLTGAVPPDQLLNLLLAVASTWSAGAPELAEEPAAADVLAARRAAVVWAVGRLAAPDGH